MNTTQAERRYSSTPSSPGIAGQEAAFVTTHWSVVLTAGRTDTTRARHALSKLCQTYWNPLYAHVRRRGYAMHDAQDLTQEFFAQLLERESLQSADPQRGRFRSFILTALNHFLINQWNKNHARKRGGHAQIFSIDLAAAEEWLAGEPAGQLSPDKAFEKQWALTLLHEVVNRLEMEYQREGKKDLFSALSQSLASPRESQPYAELAATLKMTEGAVKVAVHRMRKRYRELIRDEIAHTVDSTQDIDGEMRHLFRALTEK